MFDNMMLFSFPTRPCESESIRIFVFMRVLYTRAVAFASIEKESRKAHSQAKPAHAFSFGKIHNQSKARIRRLRLLMHFPSENGSKRKRKQPHKWAVFFFFWFRFPQEVPQIGIEPILCCQNGILSPARLPVPPLRHVDMYHESILYRILCRSSSGILIREVVKYKCFFQLVVSFLL